MTELVTTTATTKPQLLDLPPMEMAARASEIANVLASIIEKQHLYVNIQGKKYVKVDGWATMGSMLGLTVREKDVKRLADGSYEAAVEIVSFATGKVLGGASALCSTSEKRWGAADEYARRSMAVTRAVGKAYRINFSWILTMAGYAATPAEEMPDNVEAKPQAKVSEEYTGTKEQQERVIEVLKIKQVPEELWHLVDEKMMGKRGKDLPRVIQDVMAEARTN